MTAVRSRDEMEINFIVVDLVGKRIWMGVDGVKVGEGEE